MIYVHMFKGMHGLILRWTVFLGFYFYIFNAHVMNQLKSDSYHA